jgi:acyl-CoA reductase-like NAD-dependent aldehyde dehydrogenase
VLSQTDSGWRQEIDRALSDLVGAAPRLAAASAARRAELAGECLARVGAEAEEWARSTSAAKGVASEARWVGEEFALGPTATARCLRLIMATLDSAARHGVPELPAAPRLDASGRLRVAVIPARGLYDRIAFRGFGAEVLMAEGITPANVGEHVGRALAASEPGLSLVLGAGNVSCIAAADLLGQVLLEGRATLVKLHPHFASLAPVFGRVFAPLIDQGFLRVTAGDGRIGAAAAQDERVGRIHLTGSVATFDRLVWGDDPREADRRRREDRPLLDKEVVAELGNVTPWIVVPGRWSERDLAFQAESLAGAIVSNASFNCVCPKVVVTSRGWPQRERFLELVRGCLASVPPRPAFYGGAIERYTRLVDEPAGVPPGCLPWTFLTDTDPESRPELFEEENFLSLTAETGLAETDPAAFLAAATGFVNERLAGTLAATVVVHPGQRRGLASVLEEVVARLRYGTVCINQFAGLAYVMMATPWGAHPAGTRLDPGSGVGFSHNPTMLDGVEKTVFEGPFRVAPKPVLFPSNRNVLAIMRALTDLYARPSVLRLPRLLVAAVRG